MATTTSSITINAPASAVWKALTTPELVKQWQYGSQLVTDWQVGSPITFRAEWQDQIFEQWGKVLTFEPDKELVYTLFAPRPDLEDKPENYFTMTYSLAESVDANQAVTELTITQQDPRPQATEANSSEDQDAGKAILENLKNLVEQKL